MYTHLRQYSVLKYTQPVSALDILWAMNVLATGLSPRKPELNPRPIHVVLVMDWDWITFFPSQYLCRFSTSTTISTVLHTNSFM
jgi:hypothetical protein